jgi:hypothetical protein
MSAESRTVNPVAYFTSMMTMESPYTSSAFCDVAFLPEQAQSRAAIAKKMTDFFISICIYFVFTLQSYEFIL